MGRHSRFFAVPREGDDRPIDRDTVRRVVATFRPYRRKVSLPRANTRLPITLPLLVKSSVLLPVAPITLPGAWITPVSLLTT